VQSCRPAGAAQPMSCYRVSANAVPTGDIVELMDHLHLEPVPRVVSTAREFVRERAPMLVGDSLDVVLLLTSELVTNAVIHARTPIEVGITVTDHSVVVTVHDEDLGPIPQPSGREGGWGLGLVRTFASESDMEVHPGDGKTAWFRIAREAVA
jgi:anti-sigma regulatory factor (Ser/Thr protein kinase)